MADVVLKGISKNFGKKEILKNINLEINDGEFLVLVGASGCGKSTLLRTIAGLETPTSGEIFIGTTKVNNVLPKDRDIAMVFQSYALYPHLNVKENIALGLKVRHVPNCEIERRVKRAVEILKLEDYLKAKPKELSGGQRQRVALARAIVREPKVFLMDEPLSNLDAKLRSEMRAQIKKLHNKLKATFIYVTHDQTEALTMGDRIVVLNNGRIEQIDTPDEIYKNPNNVFCATFMGTNPMNIIEAQVEEGCLLLGNITIQTNILPLDLKYFPRILVGIRPEAIACENDPSYHFNMIKFSAKITFEENLGSYRNLYFKINGQEVCASTNYQVNNYDEANFSINPKDLYFFDAQTQKPLVKNLLLNQ